MDRSTPGSSVPAISRSLRRYTSIELVMLSCVCFVSLSVYFCFPLPPNMGQKLHWKEVKDRANNLSVEVKREIRGKTKASPPAGGPSLD